jgi:hypothetical protein
MPLVRFVPTTPVFERAKTVHALDHVASVIGIYTVTTYYWYDEIQDEEMRSDAVRNGYKFFIGEHERREHLRDLRLNAP